MFVINFTIFRLHFSVFFNCLKSYAAYTLFGETFARETSTRKKILQGGKLASWGMQKVHEINLTYKK